GVSAIHDGLLKFSRKLPLNLLPPLLVMTLTTPPENRPYSAEMPPTRIVSSWTASSMYRVWGLPNRLSSTSTPLTMKMLSYPNPPEIVTWPVLNVLFVRPGASSAMSGGVRPTGSASISRLPYDWLVVTVASALGASAVTVTVSVRPASDMVVFT